jgi:hypothetical protein
MTRFIRVTKEGPGARQVGSVGIVSRAELAECSYWGSAFFDKRKDHRYYELVEDTIRQEFEYRYFTIKDEHGAVRAVQPFSSSSIRISSLA